jgi:hypothetical protein
MRSGPGADAGLSAVFFVAYAVRGECGARTGTVVRVEGGQVTRTNKVAADVELSEWAL